MHCLVLSPVILSCLLLNSHGPRVLSLISTIMSLRKVVLRRDIIVENKDINLAPWLFHSVQQFFLLPCILSAAVSFVNCLVFCLLPFHLSAALSFVRCLVICLLPCLFLARMLSCLVFACLVRSCPILACSVRSRHL